MKKSMLEGFAVIFIVLMVTCKIGFTPAFFMLKSIAYLILPMDAIKKYVFPEKSAKQKINKKHSAQSSSKAKQDPLQFYTRVVNPEEKHDMNFISLYQLFYGFFISFFVLSLSIIAVHFLKVNIDINHLIIPSLLCIFAIIFIGVLSSFSLVQKPLFLLIYISIYTLAHFGFNKLSLGPIDPKLVINDPLLLNTFILIFSLFITSSFASTIVSMATLNNIYKHPGHELFSAPVFRETILSLFRVPKKIFNILYSLSPVDLIVFIVLRIYFYDKMNDKIMNILFVVVELVISVLRIISAHDFVQLIVLARSLRGMVLFDNERSRKQAKNAERINTLSYKTIPQLIISFLLPAFLVIAAALLFLLSLLVDTELMRKLNILALYVIASCQFCTAGAQIVPTYVQEI